LRAPALVKKGHNAVVEAEVSPQFDGQGDGSPDNIQWSTGDPVGSREDILTS
jgi:hypothetical protein